MNIILTNIQNEVIIGHLLGDATLTMGNRCKNPHFVIGRISTDDVYAKWTAGILSNLLGDNGVSYYDIFDKRTKQVYHRVTVRTKALECLRPYYMEWYKNKIKVIPNIKLTPLIVAIWFADDGWISCRRSKKSNGDICNSYHYEIGFATNGFSFDEVSYLRDLLKNEIGIEFHINKTKSNCNKGWTLRHSTKGAIALVNYIKDVFPPLTRKSDKWKKDVDLWKKMWYPKCIFCNSDYIHHIGKNKSGSDQFKCLRCKKNYRSKYKELQGQVKSAKYINNLCQINQTHLETG
jgi:hypothetical protein